LAALAAVAALQSYKNGAVFQWITGPQSYALGTEDCHGTVVPSLPVLYSFLYNLGKKAETYNQKLLSKTIAKKYHQHF
jgi:hypothetical protein